MSAIHGVNYGTPTLDLNFVKNKSLIDTVSGLNLVTFTRSQTAREATYVGADGLIKTAIANEPRFDHNPTTGESLGLLVEEARTNVVTYSVIDATNWSTYNGSTITANAATAPDGTNTAALITFPAVDTRVTKSLSVGAGTVTQTVWIKAVSGTVTVRVGNPSDYGGVQHTVGTTWTRVTYTTASGSNAFGIYGSNPSTAASFYAWGAQMELGAFPTSYIPTTTATVTRAADVASMTGANFSSWYRQDEGTVFCQGISNSVSNSAYWTLQGSSSNGATVLVYPANNLTYQVVDGGSIQVNNQSFATYSSVANVKTAAAIKLNNFAVVANGGTITSDTSGTVPAVTSFVIGNYLGGGTSYDYSGTIARLTYYPVRLADAQLQALTR